MSYSAGNTTRSGDVGQMLREQTNHNLTTDSAHARLNDTTDMKVVRCEGHDGQSLRQETGLPLLPYFWL